MASPLVHEYSLLIRESHLDTFNHVNNAQYLTLFEEARWQVITERGFGLKEIQQSGTGPVVLEASLRFKREIKLREKIAFFDMKLRKIIDATPDWRKSHRSNLSDCGALVSSA